MQSIESVAPLCEICASTVARYALIVPAGLGGTAISIFIESVQAYMPTRSSQISDVILNGLGTIIGALAAKRYLIPKAHY